ncbi:TPA: hypothetical protein DEP96_03950 [Candidatus Uhrbacteria bacterium]|nr:hypothetical protein [Candidatus Uhrbacteria bacterium]
MSEDQRKGGEASGRREQLTEPELAPEVQIAVGALRTALRQNYLDPRELQELLQQVPENEATQLLAEQTGRLLNDVINPLAQNHLADFHSKRQYEEYQGGIAERKRIAIRAYEKLCQAAPGMTLGQFAIVTEFGQKLMERFEEWRQEKYETKDKTMPDPLEFIRVMEKMGPVHEDGLKAVGEKAERERKESPQYLADRLKYALGDYPQKASAIRDYIVKLHNKGAVDKVTAAITDVYLGNDPEKLRAFVTAMAVVDDVLVDGERLAMEKWRTELQVIDRRMQEGLNELADQAERKLQRDILTKLNNDFHSCWDLDARMHDAKALPSGLLEQLNKRDDERNVIFTLQDRYSAVRSRYEDLMWENNRHDKEYVIEQVERWLAEAHKNFEQLESLKVGVTPDEAAAIKAWRDFLVTGMPVMAKRLRELRGELEELPEDEELLKEAHGSLLGKLSRHAERLEREEKAELTAEQSKLLGLLKRHEGKLEVGDQEPDVQKLQGRLHLFALQRNVIELQKTVDLLRKAKRSDLVLREIKEESGNAILSNTSYLSGEKIDLWLQLIDLTVDERAALQEWRDYVEMKKKMMDSNSARHQAEYEAEQEKNKVSRLADFKRWLSGEEDGDKGFAQGCLNDLHGQGQFEAVEKLMWSEVQRVAIKEMKDLLATQDVEKIKTWIERARNVSVVFNAIDGDYLQPKERDIIGAYRNVVKITLPRAESFLIELQEGKKSGAVDRENVRDIAQKFENAILGKIATKESAFTYLKQLHALEQEAEAVRVMRWYTDRLKSDFELNRVLNGGEHAIEDELVGRRHILMEFANAVYEMKNDEYGIYNEYRDLAPTSTRILEKRLAELKSKSLVKAIEEETVPKPEAKDANKPIKPVEAAAVSVPVPEVRPGKKAELELSEEEKEETIMGQLALGSFGHVKQLLEKWGWTKEKIIADETFRWAAQKGIEKLWHEKPLARHIWVKFIEEFKLTTPVEPVKKKGKKNV